MAEIPGSQSDSTEVPATAVGQKNGVKQRRTPPVHPLLFSIYPVLALLAQNISQTPIEQSLRTFGIAIGLGVAVWLIVLLLTRGLRKSAVITSTIVLVFFSYGHLKDLTPESFHPIVSAACVLILIAVFIAAWRTKQPLYDTTAVLNLMSFVLVASSGWTVASEAHHAKGKLKVAAAKPAAGISGAPHRKLGRAAPGSPDVYYIILDAYGRADRLQQFYNFDNTPFLKELEKRGFYVADQSGANYDQTPLCLASSLSMDYLDPKQDPNPETLRQMVDDSAVANFLEDRGYHYVCIWSGLEVSRVTTAETILNDDPDLNAFETQALQMSALVQNRKLKSDRYRAHRQRIRGVFDNLDTVASLPGPKFVFAHALSPHPPFVFGAHGEEIDPAGQFSLADGSWLLSQITREAYIQGYSAQLQYVNQRVLQAIDSILAKSKIRPVIIIQGDHGSRMTVDWDSQARTDLREPFCILNAYLVPDKVRKDLYPTISPVNSFRTLFADLFNKQFKRLPDRSYYSTADQMLKFSDVTELIPVSKGPVEKPTAHIRTYNFNFQRGVK